MSILSLSSRLVLFALLLIPSTLWADNTPLAAVPLVAWDCSAPEDLELGAPQNPVNFILHGTGSNASLDIIKLVPNEDPQRAAQSVIFWTNGPKGQPVLDLAPAMMPQNLIPPAGRAVRLECGADGPPLTLPILTACLRFRLTAPMQYNGSPSMEVDGKLISFSPTLTLGVLGSGPTGKQERRIYVQVDTGSGVVRYLAAPGSGLTLNQWTTLVFSWTAKGSVNVPLLWLNGKPIALKADRADLSTPIAIKGPIWIGGDDSGMIAPLELEGFGIFDSNPAPATVLAVFEHAASPPTVAPEAQPRANTFTLLNTLNSPHAWSLSGNGLSLSAPQPGVIALDFDRMASTSPRRMMLKGDGIPMAGHDLLQFWFCIPSVMGLDAYHEVKAVFTDPSGAEIATDAFNGDSSHICPPNMRSGGLWETVTLQAPRPGRFIFRGLEIEDKGAHVRETEVYLRGFGLDRTNYRKTDLYYVVGNYRDNFSMVAFNGDGARALTDKSGDCPTPYLLLDNAVDQAKRDRPDSLNLIMEAFDKNDRLIWSGAEQGIPDTDSIDAMHKLPVPITAPGTYWIKSKSYDARTGEYFTTDWTQLCVIRGKAMELPVAGARPRGILHINPDKPWGRFEKSDPLRIDFHIDSFPSGSPKNSPVILKYDVVPYSPWVPVWDPKRKTPLTQTLSFDKPGVKSVPYHPQSSVELVMAELWVGNKCVDREERTIGVRNELDAAPSQSPSIPGLAELSALNGGLLISSQFCNLFESAGDKAVDVYAAQLDQAKRLSPLVEIIPSLERLEPIPGVYDWDYLQKFFDTSKAHGCRLILYLAQKWPSSWAPIDFMQDTDGRAHALPVVWRHMMGGYNYATGLSGPGLIKDFNTQMARHFVNETGYAAYYFENEWIPEAGPNSYDPGNRINFQHFLQERYHNIKALNHSYGTTYSSFSAVNIPTWNIADFPKAVMHGDFQDYDSYACEKFTLDSQFNAVRAEEKRRPAFIYTVNGQMSQPFLTRLQQNEGLVTNGGVHSTLDSDVYRETFCSVPGLLERMEPHDEFHFEPVPHGFDEMIFGMLGLGGRGMNFHAMYSVSPDAPFDFDAYCKDPTIGYAKVLARLHVLKELRPTEKLHDAVGILQLRDAFSYTGGLYNYSIRSLMTAIYTHAHLEPKWCGPYMDPHWLDDTRIIFVTGELIDQAEVRYLTQYVKKGGHVVLDLSSASVAFEHPDDWDGSNSFLRSLGIDSRKIDGTQVPGLGSPHDLYTVDSGAVLLLRSADAINHFSELNPALLQWAGVTNKLHNSDDPYMQMHTLHGPDANYLAVTHRGFDNNAYDGPKQWDGKIYYLAADPNTKYDVAQIWGDQDEKVGVMTGSDLAKGFNAGHFDELQMKVYRVKPLK